MKKILLLEDDEILNAAIVSAFNQDQYGFKSCYTIAAAEKELADTDFDLLLLDVNLPDGSGVRLCETVRKKSKVPIILLTVKNLETDIVYGLNAGADDYITKPFTLMVLRARVNALLRRSVESNPDESGIYNQPPFQFDFENMHFKKDSQDFELSKNEQRLLKILTANPNNILTREVLIDRIWTNHGDYIDENALSVTVKRLRGKIEDQPNNPEYIKTIYGIGYSWKTGK